MVYLLIGFEFSNRNGKKKLSKEKSKIKTPS